MAHLDKTQKKVRFQLVIAKFSLGLALLGFGSCVDLPDPAIALEDTQCQGKQAQLGVMDGFLKILCGCQEPAGEVFSPGASLTCTIRQGSTLFFHMI